jgi:putative aldouronate transport system substrate-binding protein
MKRFLNVLLALLMLVSSTALADANGNWTLADIKEKGPSRLTEEPITLKVFCGADVKPNIIDNIEENLMTQWMEERTGVHIEWIVSSGGDSVTALNMSLASGDYPDIYWGVDISNAQVISYAAQGILQPLNDYLEEYAPGLSAYLAENEMGRLTLTAPNGNIYAFPRTDGGLHVLTWRKMNVYKPWLEAYMNATGKGEPATIAEFKDMLIFFRDNDMNGNGDPSDEIPVLGTYDYLMGYMMEPFQNVPYFTDLDVKEGKVFAPFVTDAWKKGLIWLNELYTEGLIARDGFVMDDTQRRQLISQPDCMVVGCVPEASAWFMDVNAWGDRNVYEEYTALLPIEGPTGLRQAPNTDFSCKPNTYITTACKYPEIAVQWCDYWYTEEGMMVNLMGFEGITYEWVDAVNYNGTKPAVRYLEDYSYGTVTTWWNASAHRHQSPELRYTKVADPAAVETYNKEQSAKYLDFIVKESIPQRVWMTEEQANELAMIESIISSYISETNAKFIVGDLSIENDWDNYLAELNTMQLKRWIELYQEIMDAQK